MTLSLAEIQTLYNARGRDTIYQGLIGRWPMRELHTGQSVSTIVDHSDKRHDGSPTSAPTYQDSVLQWKKALAG